MINAISAADIAFIMSSSKSAWLLSPLECSPQKQNGWTLRFCFWGWIMWKIYNKTIIEFGFRMILSNYWMRLSMISWIIKTEVWVICRSRRLRQITQTRGFDDSWYHAKTEFNNCFIIHFSHNSSSETEAKHSALTSGRRHSKLNKRTPLNKPIVFIVFRILLSFWPGLLSSIVVLQLCLLHEVRAKRSAILFLRRTLQGA